MAFTMTTRLVGAFLCALSAATRASAQTFASSTAPPVMTTAPYANSTRLAPSTTYAGNLSTATAPDVYLNVPTLSVGRIELVVDDLAADINLNANVASLVKLNAGVSVGIKKVNLTIANVDAELELIVRLGHLVDIVNRVFSSLDLNPLLINTLNNVTSLVTDIVGEVDGLLGSITQGGTTLSFVVDNLGNIVQQVDGGASSIVGGYLQNMTDTGITQDLGKGQVKKVFSYSPLNALVDIVFNSAGQVLQATVEKKKSSGASSTSNAPGSSVLKSSSPATTSLVATSAVVSSNPTVAAAAPTTTSAAASTSLSASASSSES